MKKYILFLLILFAGMSAKSQVYVGGTLGLQAKVVSFDGDSDSESAFSVTPEVGYYFSDRWAVGATIPVGFGNDITTVGVFPYVRFDFAKAGIVDFFGELALGWGHISSNGYGTNGFESALRPGLKINLSKKFALVARTTFLVLSHYEDVTQFGFAINNGFELGCAFKF